MTLLRTIAAGVVAAVISFTAQAQEFTWNLANHYPATEFQSEAMQIFADTLRERTNGRLDITTHHGGSLFANPVVLESTRNGLVEMGAELMTNLGRENPLWELDGIPFLVTSYEQAKILWDVTREPLTNELAKSGVRLLYAVPWPSQGFFFDREIKSLADVKGLSMRAYNPSTTRLAELMGAVPTTVQITEMQQAFATGLISSFNTAPTSGVVYKAWEYTNYYYKTDAWLPKLMVFVREDVYQSLPDDIKEMVQQAALEAEAWGWEQSAAKVTEAEKILADNGMTVAPPSDKLKAELGEVGKTMVEEWLQKAGPEGEAVVAEFRKQTGGN
ncbi:TRAP-type C4-dicarboxylate transport system substrate-binding protein [Mesorhizobium sp. J18]|uniref:TRAP transporter substrate-binding protein n=1 Tax=Mesorhizobium sp. J18 TaxID=935263 RepID=UPI00119AF6FB|nr:TRAP transporter substrate-binding protein [Mesorhizobium sp. J18]TWG97307.1 TRAP-type C4-dicarboxylate transport system substrate-binding protein [Mesorhizobium sp. J18]